MGGSEAGLSYLLGGIGKLGGKLNIAQNIDDVIYASTDYINEELKHPRNDNIIEFAKGTVLLDIGGKKYRANVLVGYTTMKEMILYDVQDLTPTTFDTKEKKTQPTLAGNTSYTSKTVASSNDSICNSEGNVNTTNSRSMQGRADAENARKVGWDGREVVKEAAGPKVTVDGKTYILLGYDENGSKVYQDVEVLKEQAAKEKASADQDKGTQTENGQESVENSENRDKIEKQVTYGAYTDNNDPLGEKREQVAAEYYEQIRNRNRNYEIAAVSKNTGFSTGDVDAVFSHIFEKEHLFEDGEIHRFHPDYYMQHSWMRLREGKNIQKHDIILLNHELLEASIMEKDANITYEKAHEEACRKYDYKKALLEYLNEHDA